MPQFKSTVIGGPNDGQSIVSSPGPPREGDIRYVPIHVGCLLPGQSVASERRHVYRYRRETNHWVYQGVE